MKRFYTLTIAIFLASLLIALPQTVSAGDLYCLVPSMTQSDTNVWEGTIDHGDWDGTEMAGWALTMTVEPAKSAKIHKGTLELYDGSATHYGEFKGRWDSDVDMEGNFVVEGNTRGSYDATIDSGTMKIQFCPHGFDEYGYNYPANLFVGPHEWVDRDKANVGPGNPDETLVMKWSDSWFSADKEGAWCTNHVCGTNPDGTHYTWFAKIVYYPNWIDVDDDGYDDNTGGLIIWGSYLVIEHVESGTGPFIHAKPTGLGAY